MSTIPRTDVSPLSYRYLESIYRRFNHVRFLHPDPAEFLHRCPPEDRESVGLIAASLAYGQARRIQISVNDALDRLHSPAKAATQESLRSLKKKFAGFKHRFTTGDELAGLVFAAGRIIAEHGSLGAFTASFFTPSDTTVLSAVTALADALVDASSGLCRALISDPRKGSACKRLHLYFRWMVRKDAVDLGGWTGIPSSALIVPLDTHMHRFAISHGLTERNAADLKCALEITEGFRKFSPNDPVKYDFALTRQGILSTAKLYPTEHP